MPYLEFIDQKIETPCLSSKKIKKTGQGRRRLLIEPFLLSNHFGEDVKLQGSGTEATMMPTKRCPLKIYFEEDTTSPDLYNTVPIDFQKRMKLFTDNKSYPFPLPYKCKQLEIR